MVAPPVAGRSALSVEAHIRAWTQDSVFEDGPNVSGLFGWAANGWAGPAAGNQPFGGLISSRSARWSSI
jgi:hypothetical protein